MKTGKQSTRWGWSALAGRVGLLAALALLIVTVRIPLGSAGKPDLANPANPASGTAAAVPPIQIQGSQTGASPAGTATDEHARTTKAVAYKNEKLPEGPWSIHVLKIDLHNPEYELQTTLANG